MDATSATGIRRCLIIYPSHCSLPIVVQESNGSPTKGSQGLQADGDNNPAAAAASAAEATGGPSAAVEPITAPPPLSVRCRGYASSLTCYP